MDNLWKINDSLFDFTSFVESHPGGRNAILLGKGRDCTALVQSYHQFSDKGRFAKRLRIFEVSTRLSQCSSSTRLSQCSSSTRLSQCSSSTGSDPFYDALTNTVRKTLLANNIDPTTNDRCATYPRIAYYSFLVISTLLLLHRHATHPTIFFSLLLSLSGWLLGSLGHDAGHFAVSLKYPKIQQLSLHGIGFLANSTLWLHQHTYAHHSHTNDIDLDPDLHHYDTLLRVHKHFKNRPIYKNQSNRLYVIMVFSLVAFGTGLIIPLKMLATNSIHGVTQVIHYSSPACLIECFLFFYLLMLSPFLNNTHSLTHAIYIAFCVVINLSTTGILFGIFSSINHFNESSMVAGQASSASTTTSWARTQVETANNFATSSPMMFIISNGLNFQIEHHLFPNLNHEHLPLISKDVQRVCAEFNVKYENFKSLNDLFDATATYLNFLSKD